MFEILIAGLVHGVFVFFKAFQQRNVAFLHYTWVFPTSMCLSTADVFVMTVVAVRAVQTESFIMMLPIAASLGVGGAAGALVAMWAHAKYVGK